MTALFRLWASFNYRHCRANQYLAAQRGEMIDSAEWASRAMDWQREWAMAGRTMV